MTSFCSCHLEKIHSALFSSPSLGDRVPFPPPPFVLRGQKFAKWWGVQSRDVPCSWAHWADCPVWASSAGAYTFPDQWKHEKTTQTLSGQLSTFPRWMESCANSPFCLVQVPSILSIDRINGQWPSLLNPRACLSLVNGNKGKQTSLFSSDSTVILLVDGHWN